MSVGVTVRHELKCWPEMFQDVFDGRKKFDVRFDDRGFQVGHELLLREYDPFRKSFLGRSLRARVTYVGRFLPGLPRQVVGMGIEVLE